METPDHFFEESRTKKIVGGAGARVAFERVGVVFIRECNPKRRKGKRFA